MEVCARPEVELSIQPRVAHNYISLFCHLCPPFSYLQLPSLCLPVELCLQPSPLSNSIRGNSGAVRQMMHFLSFACWMWQKSPALVFYCCRLARTCCEGSASSVGDHSTLVTSDVIMRAPATLATRYKRTKLRKRNPDACQKRVLQMLRSLS